MRHVGLIGQARSGKDTAASALVRMRDYTRLAFADPLKSMALNINPYIPTGYGVTVRLAPLIADVGWELAKDRYPEVRRILQYVGQSIREQDEDYWLNVLLRKVDGADRLNMPVVVTDVRYPNEADTLRARGFTLVRIVRPEVAKAGAEVHISERALNDYPADVTIYNTASVAELKSRILEA
jgi:hypothetical protein